MKIPAIGINVAVSFELAHSSMIMCEKWPESYSGSSSALDKQPAVNRVQITIRNRYIYFKQGNLNCPFWKFEHSLSSLLTLLSSYDFAYIRKITPFPKIFNKRPPISSHAVFEFAQINTQFLLDWIISSIAEAKVRVFPVP